VPQAKYWENLIKWQSLTDSEMKRFKRLLILMCQMEKMTINNLLMHTLS